MHAMDACLCPGRSATASLAAVLEGVAVPSRWMKPHRASRQSAAPTACGEPHQDAAVAGRWFDVADRDVVAVVGSVDLVTMDACGSHNRID